ncbi:MAG: LEA type 2 family protein [Gammaproteobacteria bacterium]|nr:LEA type 2 family protein [Gammaproteobacteria bacterium]
MIPRATGHLLALLAWTLLLAGCASLTQPMDPPNVSMESFSSLPSEGAGPRFLIKLRVQNPNEQALDIAGVSYSIALMGQEVITGVSKDIPVIDGYSEGIVSLEASLKLFQLLRLLANLGQAEADELTYRFSAKIDFKGLVPTQRVEEEGLIDLKK